GSVGFRNLQHQSERSGTFREQNQAAAACKVPVPSAPQCGRWWKNKAVLVTQAVWTVLAEQQRPVKVDESRALGQQHRRRHPQRCRYNATGHDRELLSL